MTGTVKDLFALALDLYRAPIQYRAYVGKEKPIPPGFADFLDILSKREEHEVWQQFGGIQGATVQELREVGFFLLKRILFVEGADHYRVLGLPQDSDGQDIRDRYRLLIGLFHPDRMPFGDEWSELYAPKINDAYNVLKNPDKRREYDEALGLYPAPVPDEPIEEPRYWGEAGKQADGHSSVVGDQSSYVLSPENPFLGRPDEPPTPDFHEDSKNSVKPEPTTGGSGAGRLRPVLLSLFLVGGLGLAIWWFLPPGPQGPSMRETTAGGPDLETETPESQSSAVKLGSELAIPVAENSGSPEIAPLAVAVPSVAGANGTENAAEPVSGLDIETSETHPNDPPRLADASVDQQSKRDSAPDRDSITPSQQVSERSALSEASAANPSGKTADRSRLSAEPRRADKASASNAQKTPVVKSKPSPADKSSLTAAKQAPVKPGKKSLESRSMADAGTSPELKPVREQRAKETYTKAQIASSGAPPGKPASRKGPQISPTTQKLANTRKHATNTAALDVTKKATPSPVGQDRIESPGSAEQDDQGTFGDDRIRQADVDYLLYRFVNAYKNGATEDFVALFDADADTNEGRGRDRVRESYGDLFSSSSRRSMSIGEVLWRSEYRGQADIAFRVEVWVENGPWRDANRYVGEADMQVILGDKGLKITAFHHRVAPE